MNEWLFIIIFSFCNPLVELFLCIYLVYWKSSQGCRCNHFCDDSYHSTPKEGVLPFQPWFNYFSWLPLALMIPFTGPLAAIASPDGLCVGPSDQRRPHLPLDSPRLETLKSCWCLSIYQGWSVLLSISFGLSRLALEMKTCTWHPLQGFQLLAALRWVLLPETHHHFPACPLLAPVFWHPSHLCAQANCWIVEVFL